MWYNNSTRHERVAYTATLFFYVRIYVRMIFIISYK